MLRFLVSRGGWPEARVLIGRGGSRVDRCRRFCAVDGRAVADRERVRDLQWTHCRFDVAGIVGLPRSPTTLHPRTQRMMKKTASLGSGWSCAFYWSWSEPRDGGVCLSIGSVDADLRGYPRLPTSRRPRGCGPWWGCPWRASQSWIHGQSHWRAPRLKAGAGGCHPARA